MLKKEPALEFANDGSIRLSKKRPEASADTAGELRVRMCMQRRALAFQIANIASFTTIDTFISKIFALLTRKPIPGYRSVTLSQVVAADQALWQKIAQETRGQVLTSGDPKPVDRAFIEHMDSAEVTYHLLPIREPGKADPVKDPKDPKPKKNPRPPKNRQGGDDRELKAPKIDIPANCSAKNDSNQNICQNESSRVQSEEQSAGEASTYVGRKGVLESTPIQIVASKRMTSDRRIQAQWRN